MSYKISTPSEIKARLEAEAALATGTQHASLPGTAENMVVRVGTVAFYEIYRYIGYLALQILPTTAAKEFLEEHGTFWLDQARKAAASASGSVTVTGTEGAIIPAGEIVTRADGLEYSLDEDVTIDNTGSVTGNITAAQTGTDYNMVSGLTLILSATIVGIDSIITGADGISGGTDIETDTSLLGRVTDRVQNPPQGGSLNDYIQWARDVAGVTRAWCSPQQYGIGTVGVSFVMDNKTDTIIPTAAEVQTVQDYIDTVRPVTADVTVFAPAEQEVDFEIALNQNTAATRQAVQAELESFFAREATADGVTLYLSRISEVISIAAGENHHQLISPAVSPVFTFGNLPVLGTITWSDA